MSKLILIRHGQSTWNLEGLFTGWIDVDLTAQGEKEAIRAGQLLKEAGIHPDVCYTSVLKKGYPYGGANTERDGPGLDSRP